MYFSKMKVHLFLDIYKCTLYYNRYIYKLSNKKMNINKDKLIVKSNDVIQASYKLDLSEQRLLLLAITKIDRQNDKPDVPKQYKVNIKEYEKAFNVIDARKELTYAMFGCHSLVEANQKIKSGTGTKGLYFRSVCVFKEGDFLSATRWVQDVTVDHNTGDVVIIFGDKVRPLLMDLQKQFTQYNVEYIAKMSSNFSIRLYELLKQYEKIGERKFNLDELKINLAVEAVKSYKAIGEFKRKVINVAIKEINSFSDLYVEIENIKQKRTITGLKFNIFKNNRKSKAKVIQNKGAERKTNVELAEEKAQKIKGLVDLIKLMQKAGNPTDQLQAQLEKLKAE